MTVFKRPIKDLLLFTLVCAAGWQSLEKNMQWAFAVCAGIATAIVYKTQTGIFLALLRRFAQDARQAQIGGVQFTRISALDGLAKRIARKNPTFAQILSDLDPQQLTLLILSAREPGIHARSGQREAFRSLRSAGLVRSEGAIGDGAAIFPTQLGIELVEALIGSDTESKR